MDYEDCGWQYFFDNRGRCPKCRGYLVPLVGCKEEVCVGLFEKKPAINQFCEVLPQRDKMLYSAQKHWRKYKEQFDEYWAYLMKRSLMKYLERNIDNTNKKSYSKNI